MATQSRITLSLGSGEEGIAKEKMYLEAAKKAGFPTLSEWARQELDKAADKVLGKKPG